MTIFPQDTISNFEFDKILNMLIDNCISPMGRSYFSDFNFETHSNEIEIKLNQVDDFKRILENQMSFPAQSYIPLDKELEQVEIAGYALSLEQFIRIRQVLEVVESIYKFFKKKENTFEALQQIISLAVYEASILKSINHVIDDQGNVKSSASKALQKIRRSTSSKRSELDRMFKKVADKYKKMNMLTDTVESIRNGRRVLSIPAEYKRSISGILLDESESGKTSFLEPQETVNLNNEIFELERQEKREIYKILKELTAEIRESKHVMLAYQEILTQLDITRSKAKLAVDMDAVVPIISKEPILRIYHARHPILLLLNKKQKKVTVPLDLTLEKEGRILVISGPNAGGKSVCMKTVGLFQMMLQAGMLVPCDIKSEIYLFPNLFTDLGDAQSLEDELSTYSSRLKNMKHFLTEGDEDTLILVDEFGSGTDPNLGGAMAEAILSELTKLKSYGIVTTHYGNLKLFADKTEGVSNGAMAFDEHSLEPTYRLEQGHPGSSYTFIIAEKSGLSRALINNAKQLVDQDNLNFEDLLNDLQEQKQKLEDKNQELKVEDSRLKSMIRQFEALSKELEAQKKRLQYELKMKKNEELNVMDSKIRELLKELKESKDVEKAVKVQQSKIAIEKKETQKNLIDLSKELFHKKVEGDIIIGSNVKLFDGDKIGTVNEIRKNKAYVTFGSIRTLIKLEELILVASNAEDKPQKTERKFKVAKEEIVSSLDIRGMRKDEALSSLEQFIDQALMQNLDFIKVIHGRGTGVLRQMVWKKLREYKDVKEIKYEDERSGGDGATVIEF